MVARVRDACGMPVGVTTSAEIEPDPERRLELVQAWREPDYTSVNFSEPGATELMEVLAGIRVGIEAGVWTVEDTARLGASGLGGRLTRILVEPGELRLQDSEDKAADAIGLVEDIHEALDGLGLAAAAWRRGGHVGAPGRRGPQGPRHPRRPRGHPARPRRRASPGQRGTRPHRSRARSSRRLGVR